MEVGGIWHLCLCTWLSFAMNVKLFWENEVGTFQEPQWLRLWASNTGSTVSDPGQRTKILHAVWSGQKINKYLKYIKNKLKNTGYICNLYVLLMPTAVYAFREFHNTVGRTVFLCIYSERLIPLIANIYWALTVGQALLHTLSWNVFILVSQNSMK